MFTSQLVIIHNFYVKRVSFMPAKTNAVLVIDANAVLSRSGASQGFQIVARRNAEVIEGNGSV
jgi:hypothetical protein